MNEQDDTRLDNFLRDKLGTYRPDPADAVWGAIETRLGAAPPPRRSGVGRVLPAVVTGMVGLLAGWLLPHRDTPPSAPTPSAAPVAVVAIAPANSSLNPAEQAAAEFQTGAHARVTPMLNGVAAAAPAPRASRLDAPAASRGAANSSFQRRAPRVSTITSATQSSSLPSTTASAIFPDILFPLAAAETAVQAAPADSAAPGEQQRALLAEKRELARLQRRADSLLHLLSLGAEATAIAPAASAPEADEPLVARAVVVRRAPRLAHRWLLALTGAPERSFLATTTTASPDNLATLRRHHETGRTGWSTALQAEYRLSERVSVAAGAGYLRLNTELRLTEQRSSVAVQYNTSTTVNGNQTTITTTPTVEQRTTETYRVLQPTYHFLTVPLLVRYRLTPAARRTRCWADVAVGAQAQLFRGGTQVVSAADGTFQEQRAGAGAGLFRPATVAFTGALAVNYALTPRLAASLAPAVRWQTQSVYRAGTGFQQRPTTTGVQLGVHWTL